MEIESKWQSINTASKGNEIVEAINLIEKVFEIYIDLELKKIKSLINAFNVMEK